MNIAAMINYGSKNNDLFPFLSLKYPVAIPPKKLPISFIIGMVEE